MRLRAHPSDSCLFHAIVPGADEAECRRPPAGMVVGVWRIIGGGTSDRLDVTLTGVCANGIALRSPVPLDRGGVYQLDLGADDRILVQINRSRRRFDGTYDVGARHA